MGAQPLLCAVSKVSVSIPAESGHVALPELARFPRKLIRCWAHPFPAWLPQLWVYFPLTGSFLWAVGTPSPASRPLPSPPRSSLGPSPAPPSPPGRRVSATPPAQAHLLCETFQGLPVPPPSEMPMSLELNRRPESEMLSWGWCSGCCRTDSLAIGRPSLGLQSGDLWSLERDLQRPRRA